LIASVSVVAVGRDDALVDAPSSFDLDVSVFGENGGQAGPLLVGEQVGASGQHAPDALERVTRAVPLSAGGLLNALSAAVGRVASQHNHMRWTHHRDTVGQLVASGRLETGELVHHDDLDPVPEGRALRQEPDREHLFGAAFDQVQQLRRPAPARTGVRSIIAVTNLSPRCVRRQVCSS
jgi:hypothetical protein